MINHIKNAWLTLPEWLRVFLIISTITLSLYLGLYFIGYIRILWCSKLFGLLLVIFSITVLWFTDKKEKQSNGKIQEAPKNLISLLYLLISERRAILFLFILFIVSSRRYYVPLDNIPSNELAKNEHLSQRRRNF